MVTRDNLIYSIAAAQRILGIKTGIYQVQEWAWVVWVRGVNFCRFYSKKVFCKHFVDRRKEQAKAIEVVQNPSNENEFKAISKSNTYRLETQADRVTCTCEDYRNQRNILGGGICKHGYAVLFQIGFTSLKDYLDREVITARIPEPENRSHMGYVTYQRKSGEPRRKGRSVD